MAEKPEDQMTIDKKISQAKDLFGRGSRNYYVKSFMESAEELSQVCSIYSEIYGPKADELGMPYLLYAKSLISVAQDENKLMDIPEEEEDEEEEEDGEDDDMPEENGEEDKMEPGTSTTTATNGHLKEKTDVDSGEPQPESSKTNGDDTKDENDDEEDSPAASLQVAWEVLELAVMIFERQGEKSTIHLAEAYAELANISLENSHFEIAIKDYKKSMDTYTDLPEPNRRVLAEIKYKIGLCYLMLEDFKEAVMSMNSACQYLNDEMDVEKEKENQTDQVKANIKDLEDTKLEIMNKITEVEESNKQSIAEIKRELSKLIGGGAGSSSADGAGTSAEANKPKALDISHLIKRKKPENQPEVDDAKVVTGGSDNAQISSSSSGGVELSTESAKPINIKRKNPETGTEDEPLTKKPSI